LPTFDEMIDSDACVERSPDIAVARAELKPMMIACLDLLH
jgi:hypothetical protein